MNLLARSRDNFRESQLISIILFPLLLLLLLPLLWRCIAADLALDGIETTTMTADGPVRPAHPPSHRPARQRSTSLGVGGGATGAAHYVRRIASDLR